MGELEGKVALVTGASKESGIGRAIALRLARDGAGVAVADMCNEKDGKDEIWNGLNERVREIEALGRSALAVHVDITGEEAVAGMMKAVEEKFGRLDVVCNNAGAAFGMNLSYMISTADWRRRNSRRPRHYISNARSAANPRGTIRTTGTLPAGRRKLWSGG